MEFSHRCMLGWVASCLESCSIWVYSFLIFDSGVIELWILNVALCDCKYELFSLAGSRESTDCLPCARRELDVHPAG